MNVERKKKTSRIARCTCIDGTETWKNERTLKWQPERLAGRQHALKPATTGPHLSATLKSDVIPLVRTEGITGLAGARATGGATLPGACVHCRSISSSGTRAPGLPVDQSHEAEADSDNRHSIPFSFVHSLATIKLWVTGHCFSDAFNHLSFFHFPSNHERMNPELIRVLSCTSFIVWL